MSDVWTVVAVSLALGVGLFWIEAAERRKRRRRKEFFAQMAEHMRDAENNPG